MKRTHALGSLPPALRFSQALRRRRAPWSAWFRLRRVFAPALVGTPIWLRPFTRTNAEAAPGRTESIRTERSETVVRVEARAIPTTILVEARRASFAAGAAGQQPPLLARSTRAKSPRRRGRERTFAIPNAPVLGVAAPVRSSSRRVDASAPFVRTGALPSPHLPVTVVRVEHALSKLETRFRFVEHTPAPFVPGPDHSERPRRVRRLAIPAVQEGRSATERFFPRQKASGERESSARSDRSGPTTPRIARARRLGKSSSAASSIMVRHGRPLPTTVAPRASARASAELAQDTGRDEGRARSFGSPRSLSFVPLPAATAASSASRGQPSPRRQVSSEPLALPLTRIPSLGLATPSEPPPAAELFVQKTPRVNAEALTLLRRVERGTDAGALVDTLGKKLEAALERRLSERVESAVARELALDSGYARRFGERLNAGIYDSLILEKERLGWE